MYSFASGFFHSVFLREVPGGLAVKDLALSTVVVQVPDVARVQSLGWDLPSRTAWPKIIITMFLGEISMLR